MNKKFNLKLVIKATVDGIRFNQKKLENGEYENDYSTYQIRTVVLDKNGVEDIKTLKINKPITKEEAQALIGKTVELVNPEEYKFVEKMEINGKTFEKITYHYSAEDVKEIENKTGETVYDVNKIVEMFVENVVDTTKEFNNNRTVSSTFTVKIQNDLDVVVKRVVVKELPVALANTFKGKNVRFQHVQAKKQNGKTVYYSEAKPEIIK